jgi:hypothetical protein
VHGHDESRAYGEHTDTPDEATQERETVPCRAPEEPLFLRSIEERRLAEGACQ